MHSTKTHLYIKQTPRTSSDLTHGGDWRVVRRDATEGFGLHRSVAGDAQHQREETLVPAEGLLGQLATRQRGGQREMELDEGKETQRI